jgi:hypothetical protein
VGDYVTVTGTVRGGTLKVNALNANIGIFTAEGTKPAYVTCESVNYGVITDQIVAELPETRAVVFTTDPTQTINWYAQDIDPCTGNVTERLLLQVQPQINAAPIGRGVFRLGKANVDPPPRNAVFRLALGVADGVAGGIRAGQFVQPIFNYIFPELPTAGAPALENRFDVIDFLGKGYGPYVPGKFGFPAPTPGVIVGQLNPWPGSKPPAKTSCPPIVPPATSSVVLPSSTSSAPPAGTPTPPVDTISLLSATKAVSHRNGFFRVTVTAATSSLDPKTVLTFNVNGATPITGATMTQDLKNPGTWSGNINFKGTPSSVQVFSNLGGKSQIVPI